MQGAKPADLGHSDQGLEEEAKVTSQMIRVHQKVRQSFARELSVPVLCKQEMSLENYRALQIKVLIQTEMRHNQVSIFFLAPKDLPLKTRTGSQRRVTQVASALNKQPRFGHRSSLPVNFETALCWIFSRQPQVASRTLWVFIN